MTCNRPITAYYSNQLNESGKRSLVFNRRSAYMGSDPEYAAPLEIPCSKCLGCKADQSLMWSIRAYHESTLHEQNSFLTLTYDDQNFPKDGKISKRDLQLFFKKLRKILPPKSIRYIACGEYGGLTNRPHYHAIIFGRDFLEGAQTLKDDMYTNPLVYETWGKGHVAIAPVNMGSICYVCGYVQKKIDDPDTFTLMSRRPGIGHTFLDRYADDIRRTGVVSIEGRAYQVPKRYFDWSDDLDDVKKLRKEFAVKQQKVKSSLERFKAGLSREEKLKCKAKAKNLMGKM